MFIIIFILLLFVNYCYFIIINFCFVCVEVFLSLFVCLLFGFLVGFVAVAAAQWCKCLSGKQY